ncbi:MAG: bifunctional hydroxymethylpyrimidine kinase/phosphomethylpyrimidine kinase [Acidobacteriota bacterium]|nr:bifunctional hydroxymethylpyrimidine kinase/phosphomethylpyrimidine kinase [Acidobacteriota bacterium]
MKAVALTIAGSDPSGGAGIQADLKTFHQFGVYGQAVISLLTVQNTRQVSRVETVPVDFVLEQLEAVIADMPPAAAKTGALGSTEIVECVAKLARTFEFPLVVDPVMISKHGAPLLSRSAAEALKRKLLPCATLITPNIPEAELLSGMHIEDEEDIRFAAEHLLTLGCKAVLIKGGHSTGQPVDFLFDGSDFTAFPGIRVHSAHTHGTGCAYSAAITALLATGHELKRAVAAAKEFIQCAIETAPDLGSGNGPINHFADVGAVSEMGRLR